MTNEYKIDRFLHHFNEGHASSSKIVVIAYKKSFHLLVNKMNESVMASSKIKPEYSRSILGIAVMSLNE